MHKAISIALAFAVTAAAAATPAFARSQHPRHTRQAPVSSPALGMAATAPTYGRYYDRRYPQTQPPASGKIDSGYYPPRTWDEISVSGPNSY